MSYIVTEYPELSWSFSRMKLLKKCQRAYFYNYYGFHNGWKNNATPLSKKIYRLKKLQPIDCHLGQIIHEIIKNLITYEKKEMVTSDMLRKLTNKRINKAYLESKNCLENWVIKPKEFTMLSEIYYDGIIANEKRDKVVSKINLITKNILTSQSFKEITEKDVKILQLDELKKFEVLGINAYLKIDALYKRGNKYTIIDWKTSAKESMDDIEQLLFYVWYVNRILKVDIKNIEARLEYLILQKTEVYSFGEAEMAIIDNRFNIEIKRIYDYLTDATLNKPIEIDKFYQARCSQCSSCNYREIC